MNHQNSLEDTPAVTSTWLTRFIEDVIVKGKNYKKYFWATFLMMFVYCFFDRNIEYFFADYSLGVFVKFLIIFLISFLYLLNTTYLGGLVTHWLFALSKRKRKLSYSVSCRAATILVTFIMPFSLLLGLMMLPSLEACLAEDYLPLRFLASALSLSLFYIYLQFRIAKQLTNRSYPRLILAYIILSVIMFLFVIFAMMVFSPVIELIKSSIL